MTKRQVARTAWRNEWKRYTWINAHGTKRPPANRRARRQAWREEWRERERPVNTELAGRLK